MDDDTWWKSPGLSCGPYEISLDDGEADDFAVWQIQAAGTR